jgi:hypothetical protein
VCGASSAGVACMCPLLIHCGGGAGVVLDVVADEGKLWLKFEDPGVVLDELDERHLCRTQGT